MVNTSNQRIGAVSFCFVGLANAPTYGLTRVRFNGRGRKINTGLAVELGTFGSASGADGALTLAQTGNFTPVGPDPVPEIPAGQTPPSGPQLNTPSIPVVVAYVALVTRDNFWNRVVITSVPGPAIRMVSLSEAAARSIARPGARPAPRGQRATHRGCGAAPPPKPPPSNPDTPPVAQSNLTPAELQRAAVPLIRPSAAAPRRPPARPFRIEARHPIIMKGVVPRRNALKLFQLLAAALPQQTANFEHCSIHAPAALRTHLPHPRNPHSRATGRASAAERAHIGWCSPPPPIDLHITLLASLLHPWISHIECYGWGRVQFRPSSRFHRHPPGLRTSSATGRGNLKKIHLVGLRLCPRPGMLHACVAGQLFIAILLH
jgi:hypothetical protein